MYKHGCEIVLCNSKSVCATVAMARVIVGIGWLEDEGRGRNVTPINDLPNEGVGVGFVCNAVQLALG